MSFPSDSHALAFQRNVITAGPSTVTAASTVKGLQPRVLGIKCIEMTESAGVGGQQVVLQSVTFEKQNENRHLRGVPVLEDFFPYLSCGAHLKVYAFQPLPQA